MLLVKTTLKESKTGGIGLFAAQFIAKSTMTFKFVPELDTAYDDADVALMSEAAREKFWNYAYRDPQLKGKQYVLCFDDARFINHSSTPNIASDHILQVDIALRDIQEGEELLCDYEHYEPDYFKRRGLEKDTFKPLTPGQ